MKNETIEMTRLQLVNWYETQQGQIIEFGKHNRISGSNGAGKSVIIDALTYGLTNREVFNQAKANQSNPKPGEKTEKRTLLGYIRGYKGGEDIFYLRSGDIISYILIEFYDNKLDKYFVLMSYIEAYSDDSPKPDKKEKYIFSDDMGKSSGVRLEDIHWNLDNEILRPMDIQELLSVGTMKQVKNIRQELSRRFRIIDWEAHTKAYIQMVSVGKLNIVDFFNKIILGEKPVRYRAFSDIYQALIQNTEILKKQKEQVIALEPIIQKIYRMNEARDRILIGKYLNEYIDLKATKQEIQNDTEQMHSVSSKKDFCESDLYEKIADIDEKQKHIQTLRQSLSEDYKSRKYAIEKRKDELAAQIRLNDNNVSRLNALCDRLSILSNADTSYEADIHSFQHAVQNEHYNYAGAVDTYQSIRSRIDENISDLDEKNFQLRQLKSKTQEQIDKKMQDMERIKKGSTVSKDIQDFVFSCRKYLESQSHPGLKNGDLWILWDVIELDDEWRPHLEWLLRSEQNTIITTPALYHEVMKYNDMQKKRYTVINAPVIAYKYGRISSNYKNWTKEGRNIVSKIEVANPFVKEYLLLCYGNILLCDTIKDFESKEVRNVRGMTKNGWYFNGYKNIPVPINTIQFMIGRKGLEAQREKLEKQLKNDDVTLKDCERKLRDNKVFLLKLHQARFDNVAEYINAYRKKSEIESEITSMEKSLSELDSEFNVKAITDAIQSESSSVIALQDETNLLRNQIAEYGVILSNLTEHIKANEEKSGALENAWNGLDGVMRANVLKEYNQRTLRVDASKLRFSHNYEEEFRREFKTQQTEILSRLGHFDRTYIEFYSDPDESDDDMIQRHADEYYRLKSDSSGESIKRLKEAQDKAKEMMRQDIVVDLYTNIQSAKKTIAEIQSTLRNVTFGEETYRISCNITNNAEYAPMARLIQQLGKEYTSTVENDSPELSKYEDDLLNFLLDSLGLNNSSSASNKHMKECLDYRSYIHIRVDADRKDGAGWVNLNKKGDTDSGGQTQNLFYFITTAGLIKTCSDDSLRLAVTDEAFNNMDGSKLNSFLQYLINNNFQYIMVSPGINSNIEKFLDTQITISSIKEKNVQLIRSKKIDNTRKISGAMNIKFQAS